MKDGKSEGGRERPPRGNEAGNEARRDRLKLALRENLKRRKMQARERGKTTDAPSEDREASPHGEVGRRSD